MRRGQYSAVSTASTIRARGSDMTVPWTGPRRPVVTGPVRSHLARRRYPFRYRARANLPSMRPSTSRSAPPTATILPSRLDRDRAGPRTQDADRIARDGRPEGCPQLPLVAERPVERAIGVVANEREGGDLAPLVSGHADGHDLPVGLDRDVAGAVVVLREVRDDLAVAAERGVEGAVVVEASHAEAAGVLAAEAGVARDDDLPVGLDRHAAGAVAAARASVGELDGRHAAGPERGVDAPVGLVPDDVDPVPARLRPGVAGDDDLPVGLDRHGVGRVVPDADAGRHLAVAVEGGIERAVGVEASERELTRGPTWFRRPRSCRRPGSPRRWRRHTPRG